MGNERSMPAVAILLLLCCLGEATAINSIGTDSVLVIAMGQVSQTEDFDAGHFCFILLPALLDSITSSRDIPPQMEFDEFHNLPPPAKF